jgi:hypothetical protein
LRKISKSFNERKEYDKNSKIMPRQRAISQYEMLERGPE